MDIFTDIRKPRLSFEQLRTRKGLVNAVFFHRPEEPFGFLSNWYPAKFTLDGIRFTSSEQYIMYQRCLLVRDIASSKAVLSTDDPEVQQKIGRKAASMNNILWSRKRLEIAQRGILAKFSQNRNLKKQLLATRDAYLVECAYSDTFWTCGRRLNEKERMDVSKWRGKNMLGYTLMEVRKMLT